MGIEIPLLTPEYAADPRPAWKRLRGEAPVLWSEPFGFWVVSKYDDVVMMLKNPDDFSSSIGSAGGLAPQADGGAGAGVGFLPMIQHDPPDHTRLRGLLSRVFSPRRISDMEPRIRGIAADLVAEIRRKAEAGESLDLYRDFASPLPVIVIAEMLGVPATERERLGFWADATGIGSGGRYSLDVRARAVKQIDACLAGLIEKRRSEPEDDLISALVQISDEDGNRLRSNELLGFCKLLWIAGNETTTNLISNASLILRERPDLLDELRANGSLIPAFVEEALRYEGPVNGLFRVATRDLEIQGQRIGKGQPVWLLFSSANRDGDHFPDPDRFDLHRKPNDHLAFGFGIHFCLGAALARLEARVAFEALTEILPSLELYPEQGERIPTPILRGWLKLPMTWKEGAEAGACP